MRRSDAMQCASCYISPCSNSLSVNCNRKSIPHSRRITTVGWKKIHVMNLAPRCVPLRGSPWGGRIWPGGDRGHFSLQGEGHCCSSNTHETQANTNETQAIWPGGAQGIFHCSISLEEGHCCSSNTNETVRHKLTLKIQQTNMHFSLLDPTLWDVRPQTHRRQKLTLKRNSNNKIAFIELSKLCFGVKTKLFNVSGKRVKEMMYAFAQDCLRSNSKKWNGRQKQTN